ncbi:MAG: molybdopterin cofactor-binding domain-containing protein, partial [Bacteroidota bacterium]
MNNPHNQSFDRRSFIKVSAVAGGGILVGVNWLADQLRATADRELVEPVSMNAYIQIAPDGTITIASPNPEVGQGVKTAMPMIVAEELDADWSRVRVRQAPLDTVNFTRQVAGGSGSIKAAWMGLRTA